MKEHIAIALKYNILCVPAVIKQKRKKEKKQNKNNNNKTFHLNKLIHCELSLKIPMGTSSVLLLLFMNLCGFIFGHFDKCMLFVHFVCSVPAINSLDHNLN